MPPGHRVLVNGAAGGVGAIALQLAKAYGAHVTGVDHARKLALVTSLGADDVIDYTSDDYTQGGRQWDLIFDVPGNHSFDQTRKALAPGGAYILIAHDAFGATGHRWLGSIPRLLGLMVRSAVVPELRGGSFRSPDKRELMATLAQLLETGQLRIVVDRTFPLEEAAAAWATWCPDSPWGGSSSPSTPDPARLARRRPTPRSGSRGEVVGPPPCEARCDRPMLTGSTPRTHPEETDMVTVLMTHEVDDLKHWLESPDRGPAFASVGFTVETFVDPTASNKVGILLEGPSLDELQSMLDSPFAADVMKRDGVRPETIVTYVHQGQGGTR